MDTGDQIKWQIVTGAAGLVGRYVVKELLQNGYHVKALYNHTIPLLQNHDKLQLIQCDILDVVLLPEILQHAHTVYHCAGLVSYQAADHDKLYKINVEGTANIVNACLISKISKLIHVSSVSALAREPDQEMITEKIIWLKKQDTSVYGHSKFLGEMEVWRGIEEGLNAVIVNPAIILGQGNWDDGSTKIFKTVYNELPWYSEGEMGFVGVQDLAKVMRLLAESDLQAQRYILSAENQTYKAVFTQIAVCFNKRPPYKKVTSLMAWLVITAGKLRHMLTGKTPFITKETAASAMRINRYDNSKLLKALSHFSYTPITEVIQNTCAGFLQILNKQ